MFCGNRSINMEDDLMGFFKDFKEDLSEAVNGLTDNELENESDERDDDLMVNTLDEIGRAHV